MHTKEGTALELHHFVPHDSECHLTHYLSSYVSPNFGTILQNLKLRLLEAETPVDIPL